MTKLEKVTIELELLNDIYHACDEHQTMINVLEKIRELSKKYNDLENDRYSILISRGIKFGNYYRKIDTSRWLTGRCAYLN